MIPVSCKLDAPRQDPEYHDLEMSQSLETKQQLHQSKLTQLPEIPDDNDFEVGCRSGLTGREVRRDGKEPQLDRQGQTTPARKE